MSVDKDLRSISKAAILHLISEGTIAGPADAFYTGNADDALKSIFFDDTPIQNRDDTFNFEGVDFDYRDGSQAADEYIPGWTVVESDSASFTDEITNTGWIGRTTSENDVDAVRITIKTNGFFHSNKKGKMFGTEAQLIVETATESGSYAQIIPNATNSGVLKGLSLSGYEYNLRIERPDWGTDADKNKPWRFRIRRADVPKNESRDKNQTFFKKHTELKDSKEAYEDSAILGMKYDAEATGGALPKTDGVWAGILCNVPTTFVRTTFNTDGSVNTWGHYLKSAGVPADGPNDLQAAYDYWIDEGAAYNTVWTQDPAWILRELILNDRFGIGTFIDKDDVDDDSFFEYSYYNCELVDDGITGGGVFPADKEPRFTYNGPIAKRESAKKVLQSICAMSRAYLFSAGSTIRVIQDRPTAPVALLTNANVIDGVFTYAGSSLQDHITSMNVTFSDKTDRFLPKTINVSDYIHDTSNNVWRRWKESDGAYALLDNTAIERYALNAKSFAAVGVTSEGQAIRQANWAMDTNLNSNMRVKFKVSWNNAMIEPGDIIEVSDSVYTSDRHGGYVSVSTSNSITLDIPVTLTDSAYVLHILDNNSNTVSTHNVIESNGTFASINIDGTFGALPVKGQTWIIEGPTANSGGITVTPRQFRVVGISEDKQPGVLAVDALEYDPTKFARVETGVVVARPVFSPIGGNTIEPVQNIVVTTTQSTNINGDITSTDMSIDWDDLTVTTDDALGNAVTTIDPNLDSYLVRWRFANNNWESSGYITTSQFTVPDIETGVYDIAVFAVSIRGTKSPGTYITFDSEVDTSSISILSPIQASTFVCTEGAETFSTRDLTVVWEDPNLDDTGISGAPNAATVKDYVVEVTASDDSVLREVIVTEPTYTYSYGNNIADGLSRSVKIKVYVRDTRFRKTNAVTKTFNNPAPSALTLDDPAAVIFPGMGYRVRHTGYSGDAEGVVIWQSKTTDFPSGGQPDDSFKIKEDAGSFHDVEADNDATYYVRIAAYDTFSKTDLNVASFIVATLGATPVVTPGTITTLTAVPSYDTANATSILDINWSASVDANSYDVEVIRVSTGTIVTFNVLAPTTELTVDVIPAEDYSVKVRGRNSGAVGTWKVLASVTSLVDTTAPDAPVLVSVTPGLGSASLRWTNPDVIDYDVSNIYYNTSNTWSSATLFGTTRGENLFVDPLTSGTTYWFWVTAVDTSGNESVQSNNKSTIPTSVPVGLTDGSVQTVHIADDAITAPLILASSIYGNKGAFNHIAAGSIQATDIDAKTITADEIKANSITADELNANSISVGTANASGGVVTITDGYVSTDHIQTGSLVVGDSSLPNGAITITGDYITAPMIDAGEVTAKHIASNEIITNSANIKKSVITTAHIIDAEITSAKISNQIQSSNWDNTAKTGWRLSGTQTGAGFIEANNIAIYSGGQVILASGESSVRNAANAANSAALGGTSANTVKNDITSAQTDAETAIQDAAAAQQRAIDAEANAISTADTAADAKVAAEKVRADAYADGIVTAEEERAIADATAKADAAQSAAIAAASTDATAKANAAELDAISAANTAADAKVAAEKVRADAYADDIVTAEEERAIADATAKANAAKSAAIAAASADATAKADAAQSAATNAAQTKADLAETRSKAYADDIVDDEEARAIADATAKANAAKSAAIAAASADATAKANAAELDAISAANTAADAKVAAEKTRADAYADGIVDDEEARAIADATAKADAAEARAKSAASADATAKANAAQSAATNAAQTKADLAETRSKAYADGVVDDEEARAIAAATIAAAEAEDAAAALNNNLVRGVFTTETSSINFWNSGTQNDVTSPLPGFTTAFRSGARDATWKNGAFAGVAGEVIYMSAWVNTENLSFRDGSRQKVQLGGQMYVNGVAKSVWKFSDGTEDIDFVYNGSDWVLLKTKMTIPAGHNGFRPYLHIAGWTSNTEPKIQGYVQWQDVSFSRVAHDAAVSEVRAHADAIVALEKTRADAYADDIVTEEEARAIADATAKANEAKSAAIAAASADATAKANAAEVDAIAAANTAAAAKADLAETRSKAYADDIVTEEEERAIADATAKAEAAEARAKSAASADATAKADAAEARAIVAANTAAEAEADAAETRSKAYADDIVTEEEARAIADATAKANEAKSAAIAAASADATAKANAAEVDAIAAADTAAKANIALEKTRADAYADDIVTAEEERAIADATAKAEAAEARAKSAAAADATAKADAAEARAKADAAAAKAEADSKAEVFYQTTQPSNTASIGDLWVDTNDDNTLWVKATATAWQLLETHSAIGALKAADSALPVYTDTFSHSFQNTTLTKTFNPGANHGEGFLSVKLVDAEGGVTVYMNNVSLGVPRGNDNETRWFSYPVTTVSGTNTIKIVGTGSDGGSWIAAVVTKDGVGDPQSLLNASTAQSTANTANSTATTAKNTANTAKNTADTAKSTADGANTAAGNAQSTANTANAEAKLSGAGAASGGGNLIANGDMLAVDSRGAVAGVEPCYTSREVSNVGRASLPDAMGGKVLDLQSSDTSIGCSFPAIRIDPNAKYLVQVRFKCSGSAASSGMYIRAWEYDGVLAAGKTHIFSNSGTTGVGQDATRQITSMRENGSVGTSWGNVGYTYTPTASAQWFSIGILNWTDLGTRSLYIDQVRVSVIQPETVNENNPITSGTASTYIASAAIDTAQIASAAIENAKIANGAITNAKIGSAAVTEAKIGSAAITAAKIKDGNITNAKIGNAAVTNAKIGNAAVTNAKIGNLAVDTLKIANRAVTIPANAYTAASTSVTSSSTGTKVQSLTVTGTGQPAVITFSCFKNSAGERIWVKVGTSTVYSLSIRDVGNLMSGALGVSFSGSKEISLWVQGNRTTSVSNRSLTFLEVKK